MSYIYAIVPTLLELGLVIDPTPSQSGKEAVVGQLDEISAAAAKASNAGEQVGASVSQGADKAAEALGRVAPAAQRSAEATASLERGTNTLKSSISSIQAEIERLAGSNDAMADATKRAAKEQRDLQDSMDFTHQTAQPQVAAAPHPPSDLPRDTPLDVKALQQAFANLSLSIDNAIKSFASLQTTLSSVSQSVGQLTASNDAMAGSAERAAKEQAALENLQPAPVFNNERALEIARGAPEIQQAYAEIARTIPEKFQAAFEATAAGAAKWAGQSKESINQVVQSFYSFAERVTKTPIKINIVDGGEVERTLEQADAALARFQERANTLRSVSIEGTTAPFLAAPLEDSAGKPGGFIPPPPASPIVHPDRPTFVPSATPAITSTAGDLRKLSTAPTEIGGLPYPKITSEIKALTEAEEAATTGSNLLSTSLGRTARTEALGTFDRFSHSLRGTHQLLFALAGLFGPLQQHVLSLASGVAAADVAFDKLNQRQQKLTTPAVEAALAAQAEAQKSLAAATEKSALVQEALKERTNQARLASDAAAAAQKRLEVAELQQQYAASKVAEARLATAVPGGDPAEAAAKVAAAEATLVRTERALTAAQAEATASTTAAETVRAQLAVTTEAAAVKEGELATATTALATADGELAAAEGAAAAATTGFLAALGPLVAIITVAAAAIAALVFAYKTLKSSIAAGREMEQLRDRLVGVTGSTKAATEELDRLRNFRFGTQFALPELVEADVKLHALGLSGQKLIDVMHQLGEASVASGQKIDSLAAIYDSVARAGAVSFDQVNELASQGLNIIPELERASGKTGNAFHFALNAGLITFDQFSKALAAATSAGGVYADGLEQQARTMDGVINGIKDRWDRWKRDFGTAIAPALADALKVFDNWIGGQGGLNASSLGEKVAAIIRAGTAAAKDGSFTVWLEGEFKKAWDYFVGLLGNIRVGDVVKSGLLAAAAAFKSALEDAAPEWLKKLNELSGGPTKAVSGFFSEYGSKPDATGITQFIHGVFADLSEGVKKLGTDPQSYAAVQRATQLDPASAKYSADVVALMSATAANTAATTANTQAQQTATESAAKILSAGASRNFGTTPSGAIDYTDDPLHGGVGIGRTLEEQIYNAHHGAGGVDLTDTNLRGIAISDQELSQLGLTLKEALGQVVTFTSAITGLSTKATIVDYGGSRPGQGPEATGATFRDVQAPVGSPALISAGNLTQSQIAKASEDAKVLAAQYRNLESAQVAFTDRLFKAPSDQSLLTEAAQQVGILQAQFDKGIIGAGEFEVRLQQLKERTVESLSAPAEHAADWAKVFNNGLLSAEDQARLTFAGVEASFRQMEDKLKTGSASATDSLIFGFQRAAHSYGTFDQQLAKLGTDATNSLTDNFATALGDIATGSKEAGQAFKDFASSVLADISRMIIKMLILYAVQQLIGLAGGFGGGGFSSPGAASSAAPFAASISNVGGSFIPRAGAVTPPTGHEGMIVGGTPTFYHEPVSPAAFELAPRLHTGENPFKGLQPGERPIIAKEGEGVFTAEQMRALAPIGGSGSGGGSQTNTFSVEINVHPETGQSDVNEKSVGSQEHQESARLLTAKFKDLLASETHPGGIIDQWGRYANIKR